MSYALFKDGKQVSKTHPSKQVVYIEAYELGAVITWGTDFTCDTPGISLADGYEVRPVGVMREQLKMGAHIPVTTIRTVARDLTPVADMMQKGGA